MTSEILATDSMFFDKMVWTIYTSVRKETDKAILLECNVDVWFPKSQITLVETNLDENTIIMPMWLFVKNKDHFTREDGRWVMRKGEEMREYILDKKVTARKK